MINKTIPAKLKTGYCTTCKTEQEFYDFKKFRVCTNCLRSKPKGRGKEWQ